MSVHQAAPSMTFPRTGFILCCACLALMTPPRLEASSEGTPSAEAAQQATVPETQCIDQWSGKYAFQGDQCDLVDGKLPPIEPIHWQDVCQPGTVGWVPSQASFDQLSWRSFLYLNWPAGSDGKPDRDMKIGIPKGGIFQSTVWQEFKNPEDFIGLAGSASTADSVPKGCDPSGPPVLTMTSKLREASIQALEASLEGGQNNSSMSGINQASDRCHAFP